MGNEKSTSKSGRGQPLGTSTTTTQGQRVGTSDTARNARAKNLVTSKPKMGVSELQKKEKILTVLDQANARQDGDYDKIISQPIKQDLTKSKKASEMIKKNKEENSSNSNIEKPSVYMSDPYSKQAMAAESRLKSKNVKKNDKDRKQKTIDLIFGDGLKEPELTKDEMKKNNEIYKHKIESRKIDYDSNKNVKKNENDLVFNDTKAANAAMNRLYGNKKTGMKERKQRTMDLLHGDLLKEDNISPKNSSSDLKPKYEEYDPEVAIVHQALLNVVNTNSKDQMPNTAKLLRKILQKIIKANSKEDQEKFGKLRMTQPKIKSNLMDINNGIELLETMGFSKKTMENKDGNMDSYMVYDFSILSRKPLMHAINVIDTHYPE